MLQSHIPGGKKELQTPPWVQSSKQIARAVVLMTKFATQLARGGLVEKHIHTSTSGII